MGSGRVGKGYLVLTTVEIEVEALEGQRLDCSLKAVERKELTR